MEQILGRKGSLTSQKRQSFADRLATQFNSHNPADIQTVDRCSKMTPELFRAEYFKKNRPVIISQAASSWMCCQKWNFNYLSEKFGDQRLLLAHANGLTCQDGQRSFEFIRLRDLTEDIRAGGKKYLRFSPLLNERQELSADMDFDWLKNMCPTRSYANTSYMFIGGRGQRTYLHNDQPCNFTVQVHGEKKWTLFRPADSIFLYPQLTNSPYVTSEVNLAQPDLTRHPLFSFARPMEAYLRPGDVLYIPPFYWHEVENFSESVAVAYRFSSLNAALRSSILFSLIRALSTNPPFWKTIKYGKIDTNLIWAHANGNIDELLFERNKEVAD